MSDKFPLSRRAVLKTMAAAAAGAAAVRSHSSWAASSPVRWVPGLQLYTLGLTPHDDLGAVFKELAAIGYREIELPGHYERAASDLRRALDEARLTCPAVHISLSPAGGMWDFTGDLPRLGADLKTLGARYAVVPMPLLPDRINHVLRHPPAGFDAAAASRLFASLEADDWRRTADMLNRTGAALARLDIRLAYHNHGLDFVPLPGGTCGHRMLVELTDPHHVEFELDIGWAASAGQDLRSLFKLLGDRLRLLHLKDTKRPASGVMDLASTDIGTGIVNWNEVLELTRHSHVEHMFVEQETPFATTPMDSVRVDYRFLTKLFGGGAA